MVERLDESFADITAAPQAASRTVAPGPEAVALLSDLYDEPDWMRQARHGAWKLRDDGLPDPKRKPGAGLISAYPLDTLRLVFSARELDGIYDLPPAGTMPWPRSDQVSGCSSIAMGPGRMRRCAGTTRSTASCSRIFTLPQDPR